MSELINLELNNYMIEDNFLRITGKGNTERFILPKPILNKGGCNLSFAGLKTAVLRVSKEIKNKKDKYDLAASFQKTIEIILNKKTEIAFKEYKKINKNKNNTFVVAGGVASNKKIRKVLTDLCFKENCWVLTPNQGNGSYGCHSAPLKRPLKGPLIYKNNIKTI